MDILTALAAFSVLLYVVATLLPVVIVTLAAAAALTYLSRHAWASTRPRWIQ